VSDTENHNHCTHKFIDLANEMKEQGYSQDLVSAALMSASGIYGTFVAAGNKGGLKPSGVDKMVSTYRRTLEHIQNRKKEEREAGQQPGTQEGS
jgi:hypothetical protein